MKTKGIRLTKDVLDAALAGGTILGGGGGGGGTGGIHISAVAPHSNGHITGPLHIHSTIGAFHRHGLTVLVHGQLLFPPFHGKM